MRDFWRRINFPLKQEADVQRTWMNLATPNGNLSYFYEEKETNCYIDSLLLLKAFDKNENFEVFRLKYCTSIFRNSIGK